MDDLTRHSDKPQNTQFHAMPHDAPRYAQSELTQPAPRLQLPPVPQVSPPAQPTVAALLLPKPLTAPHAARRVNTTNWLYVLIALAVLGFAVLFSLSAILFRRAADARTSQAPDEVSSQVAAAPLSFTATPAATIAATPGLTIQPWDGQQRFTLLLMGIDKRPGETGTVFRTDTLILISIDPSTHAIGMLSVPRDLYVSIPPNTVVGNSYGLQRINAAYAIGELVHPGSGPQLAMQTVQYNLGIRINDYVVVDFSTVIGAVDTVGGVDIDVPTAISDPEYPNMNYGYEPLYIPAGHIHMNGTLALKYARTRHQSSDLDRARRQQQVITAIRDKILSLDMAPRLIAQAPTLWGQFNSGIQTDLTLDQLIRLGLYAKDVPKANVHQGVIDYSYVTSQMWQGMSILVPNRAAIGPLMVQVFGANYNE